MSNEPFPDCPERSLARQQLIGVAPLFALLVFMLAGLVFALLTAG